MKFSKISAKYIIIQLAILDISRPHTEVGGMAPGQTTLEQCRQYEGSRGTLRQRVRDSDGGGREGRRRKRSMQTLNGQFLPFSGSPKGVIMRLDVVLVMPVIGLNVCAHK